MPRLLRRILAVVSGLLCIACVCISVRSYWVSDAVTFRRSRPAGVILKNNYWIFGSGAGGAFLTHQSDQLTFRDSSNAERFSARVIKWNNYIPDDRTDYAAASFADLDCGPVLPPGRRLHLGFGFGSTSMPGPYHSTDGWWIAFPWFAPCLFFSLLPLLALRKHRKLRQRRARGLCPTCGYDLRESKSTCPECGEKTSMLSPAP